LCLSVRKSRKKNRQVSFYMHGFESKSVHFPLCYVQGKKQGYGKPPTPPQTDNCYHLRIRFIVVPLLGHEEWNSRCRSVCTDRLIKAIGTVQTNMVILVDFVFRVKWRKILCITSIRSTFIKLWIMEDIRESWIHKKSELIRARYTPQTCISWWPSSVTAHCVPCPNYCPTCFSS